MAREDNIQGGGISLSGFHGMDLVFEVRPIGIGQIGQGLVSETR